MRTNGAYEYKDEAEKIVFSCVTELPKTTFMITREAQLVYNKIHFNTVKRLLDKLKDEGRIKGYKAGRYQLWLQ